MSQNKEFVKGLIVKKKTSQYGDFYNFGVKIDDFCENNPISERGWVNFKMFFSKDGKPYCVLDKTKNLENDKNVVKIGEISGEEIPF